MREFGACLQTSSETYFIFTEKKRSRSTPLLHVTDIALIL